MMDHSIMYLFNNRASIKMINKMDRVSLFGQWEVPMKYILAYQGNFVDDYREGNGKMTWPNGEVYEVHIYFRDHGSKAKNKVSEYLSKKIKIFTKYVHKMQGNFLEDKKEGKGKMIYSNGDVYNVSDFKLGIFLK